MRVPTKFASRLRERSLSGDELGNHTEHHHYDLTHRSRSEQSLEIAQTQARLGDITGQSQFGFRAPGYRITPPLVELLNEHRVSYDSSLFPCPPYYAAKALVLLTRRITGRRSRAVLDRPKVLLAPRSPHRLNDELRPAEHGLLELPISVTPGLGVPFIGTTLTLVGVRGAKFLSFSLRNDKIRQSRASRDSMPSTQRMGSSISLRPNPDFARRQTSNFEH
ncbi:MAG: polysaccharide deacetylase family protein [Polyangiaceae bacterium]